MIAFVLSGLTLVGALVVGAVAWLLFGRPEPVCRGCNQPESQCECDD